MRHSAITAMTSLARESCAFGKKAREGHHHTARFAGEWDIITYPVFKLLLTDDTYLILAVGLAAALAISIGEALASMRTPKLPQDSRVSQSCRCVYDQKLSIIAERSRLSPVVGICSCFQQCLRLSVETQTALSKNWEFPDFP